MSPVNMQLRNNRRRARKIRIACIPESGRPIRRMGFRRRKITRGRARAILLRPSSSQRYPPFFIRYSTCVSRFIGARRNKEAAKVGEERIALRTVGKSATLKIQCVRAKRVRFLLHSACPGKKVSFFVCPSAILATRYNPANASGSNGIDQAKFPYSGGGMRDWCGDGL